MQVSPEPADSPNGGARPALSAAQGRWLVAAAAILWSSSGLFAKSHLFDDWSPQSRGPQLAFWRALFAGLWLLPLVRTRPRSLPWRRMTPMMLAFGGMNLTYLTAMTLSTAANAIWLQSTAPWWVFVLGLLVWGQRLERREAAPLALGAAGVGLILAIELWPLTRGVETSRLASVGVGCGLASGLCYAVVVLSLRSLRQVDSVTLVVANNLASATLLSSFVLLGGAWPSPVQLAVLAVFGLVQIALPYWLFARGLRSVGSQEAAGIGLLEPVLLPLWVWLAWGETPAWWTLAGGSLILAGLVIRYVTRRPAADGE